MNDTLRQDRIWESYFDLMVSLVTQVKSKNSKRSKQNKPPLLFSFVDPIPKDIIYSDSPGVLLNGCKLVPIQNISRQVVDLPKSLYGIYYMPANTWHRNIDKEFNCFINRNDPIRQTWFYLLYHRNFLDKGYVSYNAAIRENLVNEDSDSYFDRNHRDFLSSFDHIYQDIKKIIPYKSFEETGDLRDTILRTKFSIVIETYFERADSITFSEKIFRALQTPRPWLLFGATGSVQYLRELGFYVYDDIVDHSYDLHDTSTDCINRQEEILKTAENLMNLKVTDTMIDYWESKTRNNIKIMHDWQQTYRQDFDQILDRF